MVTQCLHSLQDFCVFSFSKMGYLVFKKKFLDSATFLPQNQASQVPTSATPKEVHRVIKDW